MEKTIFKKIIKSFCSLPPQLPSCCISYLPILAAVFFTLQQPDVVSDTIFHHFDTEEEWKEWDFVDERLPFQYPKIDEPLENRNPQEMGMLPVQGAELDSPHHIVSLFSDTLWKHSDDYESTFQRAEERGGLLFWAHPERYHGPHDWEWYVNYFKKTDILIGLEIYNRYADSTPLWDNILQDLMPHRPVWGFGVDDMHHSGDFNKNYCLMILEDLSSNTLYNALLNGQFFTVSRRGFEYDFLPAVTSISTDQASSKIEIEAQNYETILWIADGEVIHSGKLLEYGTNENLSTYVRAQIQGEGGTLATQPFGFQQEEEIISLTVNPYEDICWNSFQQYKAQFHTHTTISDGYYHPHQLADNYQEAGFQILALTDHNRVTYPWTEFTSWQDIDTPSIKEERLILPNPRALLAPRGLWKRGEKRRDNFHYEVTFEVTSPLSRFQYVRIPFLVKGAHDYYELWLGTRSIRIRRYEGCYYNFKEPYRSLNNGIETNKLYTVEITGNTEKISIYKNSRHVTSIPFEETELFYGSFGLRPDQNMYIDSIIKVDSIVIKPNRQTGGIPYHIFQ